MKFLSGAAALLAAAVSLSAQDTPDENRQLPNMGFDSWHRKWGEWIPNDRYAPEGKTWDTVNKGLSLLGVNGVEPEERIVAVCGEGKKAAKVSSRKVLWAFAAGALYTGNFVRLVNLSGAELSWGVPFQHRPACLEGYYHYLPQKINYSRPPLTDMEGKGDIAQIQVLLTDWERPFRLISNYKQYVDAANDPHIIGIGELTITQKTKKYRKFSMPIEYRSERTPKWVVIVATSSRYGDCFTGGDGSVLYLDEFEFIYNN